MARVLVYLWFDVEDYITPQSDDPPKKIVEILKRNGVHATFKVAAEKIRALETRGRQDVIAALATMTVGYHLDTHSRHPTLYEYLGDKDLETGAADFFECEGEPCKFVSNALHQTPTCFGHPGPAWTPHVYPAMPKMGIPVYLDETPIINLDNSPYWYCNVLNLNGANRNFILLDYFFERPNGLEDIKKRFNQIYKRLQSGGAISILLHPHTIVNRKFWDEVNFARGRNPSKDEYIMPPQQPEQTTVRAYRDLEDFIKYVKSFPNIRFITARDAVSIFRDESSRVELGIETIRSLAWKTMKDIRHQKINGAYLSPAQIFYVMTMTARTYAATGSLTKQVIVRNTPRPFGQEENHEGQHGSYEKST